MKSGKFFGTETFDPKYIISQILLLQSAFYIIQFSTTALLNPVFGLRNDLNQIFTSYPLDFQDSFSIVYILSSILSIPFIAAAVVFVVERARKCLDFVGTIYFLHLVILTLNSGMPSNMFWWATNGITISLTVLLSEFLCMKIEQQEISLSFAVKKEEKT